MKKDQPTFTLRQVGIICERLLKDYEDKVREEYEQILSTKLAGRLPAREHCCEHYGYSLVVSQVLRTHMKELIYISESR